MVTYKGAAVPEGLISFLPTTAGSTDTISAPIAEGRYSIAAESGLALGSYRVEIEGYRKTGRKIRDLVGPERRTANPPLIEEREMFLPTRYNLESVLDAQVTADTKQLDFRLGQ